MKKIVLLLLFTVLCCEVRAQKFYVTMIAGNYEQPVLNKMIANNYQITFKKDSADFIIICNVKKMGIGRASGSVSIINKTGDLVAKSKEAIEQTTIFNGYANSGLLSIEDVADKYLIDLLKQLTYYYRRPRW